MSIGDNIRKYRKKAHLTQKELAELCDLATGTIQQYELGKREPRSEQLCKISNILNVSYAQLVDSLEAKNNICVHIGDKPFVENGVIDPEILNVKEIIEILENSPVTFLTDSEKLYVYFNSLNDEGQERAFDLLETLLEIPRYRKKSIE